jgi:N-carbamoyl-L-amino-acid hydrolase
VVAAARTTHLSPLAVSIGPRRRLHSARSLICAHFASPRFSYQFSFRFSVWNRIQTNFQEIDKEENVSTQCSEFDDIAPARTDPAMQAAIHNAAQSLGLATLDLPSGAVHDAQLMARIAPFGMIFIPSHDGISHAPQELSTWPDVANGAEVLYRSILETDTNLNKK